MLFARRVTKDDREPTGFVNAAESMRGNGWHLVQLPFRDVPVPVSWCQAKG